MVWSDSAEWLCLLRTSIAEHLVGILTPYLLSIWRIDISLPSYHSVKHLNHVNSRIADTGNETLVRGGDLIGSDVSAETPNKIFTVNSPVLESILSVSL